jgi:4-carboxymuconolactone decarboxylase
MSDRDDDTSEIDPVRIARGAAVYEAVYGGVLPAVPAGTMAFTDVMYAQLFAEQWTRPGLAHRDRRLLTLGVIAAIGDPDTWAVHLEAALRKGEISEEEARELVIHLTPYVGYPRISPMAGRTEVVIAKLARGQE